MKALVFLALLGAAFAAIEDDKVVGGYECPKNSVPYQVSLNAGYHFCGGALISSQWVVSAAHCYMSRIQVHLGEHNIAGDDTTEQWILSAQIIRHPHYNTDNLDNDIMLIKLQRPAILNMSVQTVFLPSRCPMANENCILSGWGNMDANGSNFPNTLQCLRQPILDDNICKDIYTDRFTKNMLCSGDMAGGSGSCQRDSGGPLVCNGLLHGIVSWDFGCALEGYPSVYTRVCRYTTWINGIIYNK